MRALIVEDEQIIAEDLAVEVRRPGHDVLGISISGEEAVEMADRTKPELVMMDIQIEGQMKGTEAAQIIQERIGAVIVFVTAFPGVFLREDSQPKERGICIGKPFSRMQLEAAKRPRASESS